MLASRHVYVLTNEHVEPLKLGGGLSFRGTCLAGSSASVLSDAWVGWGPAVYSGKLMETGSMGVKDYTTIERCRICRSDHLLSVLHLGHQELTGVFPGSKQEKIGRGPLELLWCGGCGLLQLGNSYHASEMYGANYGYRSGLNQSMVRHLTDKIRYLEQRTRLQPGDTVIDIGSNDATSLKAYRTPGIRRVGVDPTGDKFRSYYPSDVTLISDFFSAENISKVAQNRARIVTSIAMFYDLEDPVNFATQVSDILADDGFWHFEQSYMPSMLRMCSYDTICHEHIEYYSMSTVMHVLDCVGMQVIDVQMSSVNGGSFAVTAAKKTNPARSNRPLIEWLIEQELRMGLNTPKPYRDFEERVYRHRADLSRLLRALKSDGKLVLGYGASTKGNVVLQFCGISERELPAIAEVNEDKFGAFTPGTRIPIIPEVEARAMRPDYFLVLPWHFKDHIVQREASYLADGGKMIFPFPEIEIV
jgi:hypothetical protein